MSLTLDEVKLQLSHTPGKLPRLELLSRPESIFDYQFEDFKFTDYHPQGVIKAPIAV